MKSWKIGAIAGLIAGFIGGIMAILAVLILFNFNFQMGWVFPPLETSLGKIASNEICFNLIWGIILGVIYSKVYRVIPSKTITKGLIFGLFIFLVTDIRWLIYALIYSLYFQLPYYVIYGSFRLISFGLVLGVIYEFLRNKYLVPKKKPKIIQYDMMSGFYPGAIAGFLAGVASFIAITTYTFSVAEIWDVNVFTDFDFLISQLGGQIMWHMMFGIIWGIVFPKVYNLVPGKGIIKGLIYGLVTQYLIFELQIATVTVLYWNYMATHSIVFTGFTQAIVYGLILGLLYRKPEK